MTEVKANATDPYPDRCPSMDPWGSGLRCTRKIHDDHQCRSGGITWRKGTLIRKFEIEELVTCYHCGDKGKAGDDHTCPCPHSDATCPDHVKPHSDPVLN